MTHEQSLAELCSLAMELDQRYRDHPMPKLTIAIFYNYAGGSIGDLDLTLYINEDKESYEFSLTDFDLQGVGKVKQRIRRYIARYDELIEEGRNHA